MSHILGNEVKQDSTRIFVCQKDMHMKYYLVLKFRTTMSLRIQWCQGLDYKRIEGTKC